LINRAVKQILIFTLVFSMIFTGVIPGIVNNTVRAEETEAVSDEQEKNIIPEEEKTGEDTSEKEDEVNQEEENVEYSEGLENIESAKSDFPEEFRVENGVLISYTGTETNVVIPEGISTIGDGTKPVFEYGSDITSVTIPSTAKVISDNAFNAISNLAEVKFSDSENLEEIGSRAFWNIKVSSMNIPEGVKTIGDGALYTDSLISVSLPSTLCLASDGLVWKIFAGGSSGTKLAAGLKNITVSPKNEFLSVKNGAVYDKNGETLLFCPPGMTGDYTVESGTKAIGSYAFNQSALSRVVIPDSVTKLGNSSFVSAKIQEVNIPGSVEKTPRSAFSFALLKKINLGEGIQEIEESAFSGVGENTLMDLVVVPASVTKIGTSAFDEISGNIKILNPDTVLERGFVREYRPTIIYGYKDSTAQKYVEDAKKSGGDNCKLTFEAIQTVIEVPVTGVELSEDKVSMAVGDEKELTAMVTPDDATDKTLEWSVSPEGVVSIDQNGKVKALSEGTATVMVRSSQNTAAVDTCVVVVPHASDFVIENGVLTAYKGNKTEVVIPSTVTEIGEGVFMEKEEGDSAGIKKVVIPASVKKNRKRRIPRFRSYRSNFYVRKQA
jgi:uncharacterized protein YjdB